MTFEPRPGVPLGPDSLTWRTLGDLRLLLVGMRAGLLQTMHPAIEQGVRDHSDYFAGPFNRILRSVPQIAGVVYDEDRPATAARVRDYHRTIHGRLDDGERYHALEPDTYYWAHATFFEAQLAAMEFFGRGTSRADKERLYLESVLVWRRVSDPLYRGGVWLVRGTLPPALRTRMGLSWTIRDERRLRALGFVVRNAFGRLPWWWRMAPQVRTAYRREAAARGADVPSATRVPARLRDPEGPFW